MFTQNKKKFLYPVIHIFALSIFLVACNQPVKEPIQEKEVAKVMTEDEIIQQEKTDLVAGTFRALSYSGFRTGQHPDRGNGAVNPSSDEILEDLQILSKNNMFSLIRLYDSGENSAMVLEVIQKNKINIKVMLGIWLEAEISNHEGCHWLHEAIPVEKLADYKIRNQVEIERGIKLANQYKDIIVAVNVGNEALVEWTDHLVAIDTLISYVNRVKKEISQPITVAETCQWWADHGTDLVAAVDFMGVHIYPIWVGNDIEEAMPFTKTAMLDVRKAFPDKQVAITEAGWASVASEFGERASEEKQLKYYTDLMDWAAKMNITTFFFEAFDEDWKGNPDNAMGAEKHWGLYTVDRKPKLVMQ